MEEFDVFISHASEDKAGVARPLAEKLRQFDLKVWFDEFTLEVGDSLVESIDKGLAHSKFGIVILSKSFLNKGWPKYELHGLVTREISKEKVVLPIWHDINKQQIEEISPTLADKIALDTSKQELDEIALRLIRVIRPDIFKNITRYIKWLRFKRDAKAEFVLPTELKSGPIRHEHLPDALLIRIKIMYGILNDIVDEPFQQFVDSFQRDMHPDEEIEVWEIIVSAYLEVISTKEPSFEERKKIFRKLLYVSMQPREILQKLIDSGDDFTVEMIGAYVAAAKPSSIDGN